MQKVHPICFIFLTKNRKVLFILGVNQGMQIIVKSSQSLFL